MKLKILLVYGGKSVEHDISIITALQVMKNLPKEFDYLPIYIDKQGIWWTAENLNDVSVYENFNKFAKKKKEVSLVMGKNLVLIKKGNKYIKKEEILTCLDCCHGNIGEDGALQGCMKTCDIPYTSCGVTSSAICMDKAFMKDILKANNIVSPNYVCVRQDEFEKDPEKIEKQIKQLTFPLVVKPANLGSSIGISVVESLQELKRALELAFSFDFKVVIEEKIENLREFNCACFSYRKELFTSSVGEVTNKKEIYTFEDKYLSSNYTKNEKVEAKLSQKIATLTERLYTLFDCHGIIRVDYLFDEKAEKLYVNEINTIPGSMAFYLFKDVIFNDLLASVIEQSLIRYAKEQKKLKVFDSDALNIFKQVGDVMKK